MDINDLQNDITELSYKISQTVKETEEEFIFQTIQPYCENILERKINKKDLTNLLTNNNAGYDRGFREGEKFAIQKCIKIVSQETHDGSLCDLLEELIKQD